VHKRKKERKGKERRYCEKKEKKKSIDINTSKVVKVNSLNLDLDLL
jgi:hypothetical protein